MAFTVETLERQRVAAVGVSPLIADRRLYTNVTQDVVLEEGDVRAAFVLCGKGSTIPSTTVRRLGLAMVDGRVVQVRQYEQDVVKEVAPASEDKQAAPPAENKAVEKPAKRAGIFGRRG